MKYEHRFRVRAPLAAVADFHSRSASMPAITPPPMIVRVHAAPARLGEGDEMDFTLWAGPIPLRWAAKIEEVSPAGFTDRQLRGPFAAWAHRHTFVRVTDEITEVVDEVQAEVKRHPFWGPVGLLMWAGMPALFAFRGWKTRLLLETEN
jgi:ligand-binding SRPBCC domain-containing protein